MNIYFQFLSTRSGKAVILSFDRKTYLFNCFEGFQRYSIEVGLKIKKLDAVFLCTKESVTGLIGTLITLGSFDKGQISLMGHRYLKYVLKRANCFDNHRMLKHKVVCRYADNLIKVRKVENEGESSFFVELPKIRGRLLPGKIPSEVPKKYYSKLTERNTIILNGREYDGNEYMEDDIYPGVVALVYCTKNMDAMWEKIQSAHPRMIICFQVGFAKFLKKKGFGEQKIVALCDGATVEFMDFYNTQKSQNKDDPNFIIPTGYEAEDGCRVPRGDNNGDEAVVSHSTDIITNIMLSTDKVVFNRNAGGFLLESSGSHVRYDNTVTSNFNSTRPKIIFLGTGCSVPSKHRNVSSILVDVGGYRILLDCGEDTLYQIHRAFGTFDIVKTIDMVFISHSHADHHLGLVSLLRQSRMFNRSVKIIGPSSIRGFVEMFFNDIDFYETDNAVHLRNKFLRDGSPFHLFSNFCVDYDFKYKVRICGVPHCRTSCAIRISVDGLDISYSGDTMYDNLLKVVVKDSDLLIHEATFDDSLREKAHHSKHSTIGDAIKIWKSSNAKVLALTHLSQRYKEVKCDESSVVVASDLYVLYLKGANQ